MMTRRCNSFAVLQTFGRYMKNRMLGATRCMIEQGQHSGKEDSTTLWYWKLLSLTKRRRLLCGLLKSGKISFLQQIKLLLFDLFTVTMQWLAAFIMCLHSQYSFPCNHYCIFGIEYCLRFHKTFLGHLIVYSSWMFVYIKLNFIK